MAPQKIKADLGDLRAQGRIKEINNQINSFVDGRKRMENFPSHLGNIRSFSGFRKTTNDFALDWALVGIKQGRIGLNEASLFIPRGSAILIFLDSKKFLGKFNIGGNQSGSLEAGCI